MEIPKTLSAPADLGKPSILDLPTELRELIYDFCFKHNDTVLLHNRKAFHVRYIPTKEELEGKTEDEIWDEKCQTMDSWELGDLLLRSERAFDQMVQLEIDTLQHADELHHGFGYSINLLIACRQIYHEAANILYSRNSVTFSRILLRHDFDLEDPWHFPEQQMFYHQVHYAPLWLLGIGQNYKFLRCVRIDLDAICSEDECRLGDEDTETPLDLLLLLKIQWEKTPCDIEFVHTGHSIVDDRHLHDPRIGSHAWINRHEEHPVDHVMFFNNAFQTLGDEDALKIAQHRRSYCNLRTVRFSVGEASWDGFGQFDGPSPLSGGTLESFPAQSYYLGKISTFVALSISRDGTSAEWSRPFALDGLRLPDTTLTRIRRHMEHPPESVIDIDAQTVYGLNLDLYRVSKDFLSNGRYSLHYDRNPVYQADCQGKQLRVCGPYSSRRRATGSSMVRDEAITCGIMAFLFAQRYSRIMVRHIVWAHMENAAQVILEIRKRDRQHVDARSYLQLVITQGLKASSIFLAFSCEEKSLESNWRISNAQISLLQLRRHLFIYWTGLLVAHPHCIIPEVTAILVDCNWKIVMWREERRPRPATDENWDIFVRNPASAYNKIKDRMKQANHSTESHVGYYWGRLENILVHLVEELL